MLGVWFTDVVETLTGWLPDGLLENTAVVLLYTGVLMAIAVGPVVLWLGYAARPAGGSRERRYKVKS
jgi:hypothetical protein